ncbi:MAG: indole-3-acetate monooxygenase [Acidimicrobiaceae bacterium]
MVEVGMMEAAATVAGVAAANGDASEAGRRLARPVVEAFESSGLGALVAPTALGGMAEHPARLVEVVELIATADASAGWCSGIGMGSNFMAALVPESTAGELYTDLRRGGAGPFAPGGPARPFGDTVHVAGRWAYSSNCQQAGVLAGGVVLFEGDSPKMTPDGPAFGLAFLTADDFVVDENWNTDGLRGTGSHDVTADVHVAPERISSLWADKWPDDALFRLRSFDVLGPCLGAVPLGIGRAALDVLKAKTIADFAGPPRPGPRPRLADNPVGQAELAKAELHLRGARALLLDALDVAFAHAQRGDVPPRDVTATIGLACCEALVAGKHAVAAATSLMGSAAIREGSPLLRLRRDIDAAGSHVMFSPIVMTGLGRELAGIPTAAFPYLLAP